MRNSVLIVAAISLLAVPALAGEEPLEMPLNNPAYSKPSAPWKSVSDAKQPTVLNGVEEVRISEFAERDCRDSVAKARELVGKSPLLEREPASPDKPHLIYAVDRRQDGCSVMVMKGDPDDIRQLPLPSNRPFLVLPANKSEE